MAAVAVLAVAADTVAAVAAVVAVTVAAPRQLPAVPAVAPSPAGATAPAGPPVTTDPTRRPVPDSAADPASGTARDPASAPAAGPVPGSTPGSSPEVGPEMGPILHPSPVPGLALARELADPSVLAVPHEGIYVAYGTENSGLDIPTLTTPDLRTWSGPVDALAERPSWGRSGPTWAPSVLRRADGRHLLAYAARHDASGRMCVSVGIGDDATGPFVDRSTGPLVCDHARGGSIDPSFFVDPDGSTWLLWKTEGIPGSEPTRLFSQPIDPSSLELLGTPTLLLTQDLAWEHPIIENPSLAVLDGEYLLLYAANRWETADYATGWARCAGPAGPCEKWPEPLMVRDAARAGPGGASWFTALDGSPWIAYHGWKDGRVGHAQGGIRALYLAEPRLEDGILRVTT